MCCYMQSPSFPLLLMAKFDEGWWALWNEDMKNMMDLDSVSSAVAYMTTDGIPVPSCEHKLLFF